MESLFFLQTSLCSRTRYSTISELGHHYYKKMKGKTLPSETFLVYQLSLSQLASESGIIIATKSLRGSCNFCDIFRQKQVPNSQVNSLITEVG